MSNNRELPKTSLALAVMSLLNERPMHPYEMKTLMAERGHGNVIKLKGASLYDTVERLQRLGFIESLETSREGRRPERTVYAITEEGREELHGWLSDLLGNPVKEYPAYAAALAFILGLAKAEAIRMLESRAGQLDAQAAASASILKSISTTGLPEIVVIEEQYLQTMRQAEARFTRKIISRLRDGSLKWPSKASDWPADLRAAHHGQQKEEITR
ncbi:MAG: PadR family transcriptional regulator [Candidatus Dormibacteraeota bacterium]|nr:PadR family transcriptional regulator [Candidatus Dormibacteraeota bacterium]